MTGRDLYEMYRLAHTKRGCGTDEWEDLEDLDRDVWDALAEQICDNMHAAVKAVFSQKDGE